MYYMVHATDHPEAPKLMSRAYHATVSPSGAFEQQGLFAEPKGSTAAPIEQDPPLALKQSG
jgi:hypothetical protein